MIEITTMGRWRPSFPVVWAFIDRVLQNDDAAGTGNEDPNELASPTQKMSRQLRCGNLSVTILVRKIGQW